MHGSSTPKHSAKHSTSRTSLQHGPLLLFLVGLLAALSVSALFLERWLANTWSSLSADELIYHLNVSLAGTETSSIHNFLRNYLPSLLIVLASLLFLLFAGARSTQKLARLSLTAVSLVSVGMLAFALYDLGRMLGLGDYLLSPATSSDDFIEDHFVDARQVSITFPDSRRNLIYIYCESMETTYADISSGGAFEQNVIPELTQLAFDNECFAGNSGCLNGGRVFPGGEWTMGGLFAQATGTPLKVPIANSRLDSVDALFPEIIALGDILAEQGYHQEFLLGSEVEFGGRRAFYEPHGDFDIYDYTWAADNGFIPEDYRVFWGFEDERLFELAKLRLTELANSDEPFNLTMLTVDTHFEDGYVCRLCGQEFGEDQYSNVMACSSRQLYSLIQWIQSQSFYADTTIILCGDHTTMDSDYCESVSEEYPRKTYTCIINPAVSPENPEERRDYATFDMFPTTLAALGANIEGDRLGIGTNLFSSKATLVEELGASALRRELARQSDFLSRYSGFEIDDSLMEAARDTAIVPDITDEGLLRFQLEGASYFNYYSIKSAKLSITDSRTGESAVLDMSIDVPHGNINSYSISVTTEFTEADLPYLEAQLYMSVGDYVDYPLSHYP